MNEEPFITTAEKIENNRKSVKKLNIATAIVSVIALAGIGYGIYSAIQVIDKNQQIASLKEQLKAKGTSLPPGDTDSIGSTPKPHNINDDQALWLFHYASDTDANGNRYTIVLSQDESENKGYFNLIRSSATGLETSSGHFEYDDAAITLSIEAPTETSEALAKKMGFSFKDNKYSSSMFDEYGIRLGKILLERVR